MQNTPSPEVRHLKPLDGVRGLAILMVMFSHCFELNFNRGSAAILMVGHVVLAGRYGVDLFFVLSGFLITGILIDTRDDPQYFRRFFGRRSLRIFPLYYGTLLFLLVFSLPFHWTWNGMAWPMLTYTQNWWPYKLNTFGVGPLGLYHFWSLAIEEQFYLLWPLVVFALRRNANALRWTAIAGVCAIPVLRATLIFHGVRELYIHENLFTRADSLLIGGLLAMAYRNQKAWDAVLKFAPAVCSVGFSLIALHVVLPKFPTNSMYLDVNLMYTLLGVTMAALLAWSLKPRSLTRKLFELPALRTLGKYSYGLYVLHVFILGENLRLRLWLGSLTHNIVFSGIAAGLLCVALAMVAAWLSYHLYEKQFLRLKHHFDYTRVDPARTSR